MKNVSLVLNVVLAIAVVILYFLHFSTSEVVSSTQAIVPGHAKIAFINTDSLVKYYEYFKENRVKLEEKGKQLDQDLKNRANLLQQEIDAFQRNVNNMTIGQAKAVEDDLVRKRQNLGVFQESASQKMMDEQNQINQAFYKNLTGFLKEYSKRNDLQVVLKFDGASDMLFGGDSLDISSEVIKGLNEGYVLEKGKAKQDSIAKK